MGKSHSDWLCESRAIIKRGAGGNLRLQYHLKWPCLFGMASESDPRGRGMVLGFRGFSARERICPSQMSNLPRPESMSHMRHEFGTGFEFHALGRLPSRLPLPKAPDRLDEQTPGPPVAQAIDVPNQPLVPAAVFAGTATGVTGRGPRGAAGGSYLSTPTAPMVAPDPAMAVPVAPGSPLSITPSAAADFGDAFWSCR